jgi:hypothetical protein
MDAEAKVEKPQRRSLSLSLKKWSLEAHGIANNGGSKVSNKACLGTSFLYALTLTLWRVSSFFSMIFSTFMYV